MIDLLNFTAHSRHLFCHEVPNEHVVANGDARHHNAFADGPLPLSARCLGRAQFADLYLLRLVPVAAAEREHRGLGQLRL